MIADPTDTGLDTDGKGDLRIYQQVFDWLSEQAVHDIDPILDRCLDHYVELLRLQR